MSRLEDLTAQHTDPHGLMLSTYDLEELVDLQRHEIERQQGLLADCTVILQRAPPNYYDYGDPRHWDNAVHHKSHLLRQLRAAQHQD